MFATFFRVQVFRVQVFYSPGFSGSRFFWVQVFLGPGPGFRSSLPKCDFNKVVEQLYWNRTSTWVLPVDMLHIFRTPFLKNTFRTRHSFFPVGFTNFLRTLFYRTLPGDCFWWIGLMVKNFNFVWLIFLNSQLYHAPPEWWLLFWCNEEHFLMKKTLTKF